VVRDDVDDMINHVVYHYFQAADRSEVFQMPPKLTEEEELAVAVLISREEERRAELRAFQSSRTPWFSRWRRHHLLGHR
jgi:hypothetical protein